VNGQLAPDANRLPPAVDAGYGNRDGAPVSRPTAQAGHGRTPAARNLIPASDGTAARRPAPPVFRTRAVSETLQVRLPGAG